MKKYAVSIANIYVAHCGALYSSNPIITQPENIVSVNVPPNIIVNRVTFQVTNTNASAFASIVLSNKPPQSNKDGVLLVSSADGNAVLIPARYVFENFNEEQINETFYIANISDDAGDVLVQIIFEGYQR